MNNSEEALPFKVFEPRSSSQFRSESLSSSSTSQLNLTFGSPQQFPNNSSQQLLSPGCGEERKEGQTGCFDFTGLRRLAAREFLLDSSPTSSLLSQDLFQLTPVFSGDPDLPKRLHVSNIPFRFREHNLIMLFGKFGNVEDAEIIYNDQGSKGFGFVTMSRGRDADNALNRLNHSIVEGRIIEVNLATPRMTGLRKTGEGFVPGAYSSLSSPHSSSPGILASAQTLLEAEAKLAEAKKEVSRIRQQLKMEKFRCLSARVVDMSAPHL